MMRGVLLLLSGLIACGGAAAQAVRDPSVAGGRGIELPGEHESAPAQGSVGLDGPAPGAMALGNPLWAVPPQSLTAMQDRPLFAASRRAPPQAAPAPSSPEIELPPPTPPAPEPLQLALVGTVFDGSSEAIGVFLDQATRRVVSLKAGEGHRGWIVRSVGPREAILERGRQSTVLSLPSPEAGRARF